MFQNRMWFPILFGVFSAGVVLAPYASHANQLEGVSVIYCSKAAHAAYVTTGPDGRTYPTWHPPVQPAGKPEAGCVFGHEHGANPTNTTLQTANNALPAFGYAAAVAGMTEPHEGYKVFTAKHGTKSDNGCVFLGDTRFVFHMGTAGMGRYMQSLHSVQLDYVGYDMSGQIPAGCPQGERDGVSSPNMHGLYLHTTGLGDTDGGNPDGSVCDLPRMGGRDFSTIHETTPPDNFSGDCATPGHPESAYEIWGPLFSVCLAADYCGATSSRGTATATGAVFDPITTHDAQNNSSLVYTQNVINPNSGIDPTGPSSSFLGCDREAYFGPMYTSNNDGSGTVFYTDAYGVTNATNTRDAQHPIKQVISATWMNDLSGLKDRVNQCVPGLKAPN